MPLETHLLRMQRYSDTNLHFRGHAILTAIMDEMLTMHGMDEATDVLLSGTSAGGEPSPRQSLPVSVGLCRSLAMLTIAALACRHGNVHAHGLAARQAP